MSDEPIAELSVDVRRGQPTAEELAALVAVVTEAFEEEAAAAVAPESGRSRWRLSARGLRRPLAREGGWSGFTA